MPDILEGHICGGQHTLGAKGPECCTVLLSEPISIAEGIPCPVPAECKSQALVLCCCGNLSWGLSIFRASLLPQASTALQTSQFSLV